MRVYGSRTTAWFAALALSTTAGVASAQQVMPATEPVADIRPTGGGRGSRGEGGVRVERSPTDYYGVVPGRAEARIPGMRRTRRLATRGGVVAVEWPGFQMTPQGSRVFVAMSSAPAAVDPSSANQRVSFTLRNARIPVANNRRALETGAFETPVQRAYLRQRGRNVEVVLELRGEAQPTVTQSAGEGGLHYLFLDFPRWTGAVGVEYRPPPRRAQRPTEDQQRAQEQISIRPASGSGEPDPDEAMARAALGGQAGRPSTANTLDEPQRNAASTATPAPGGVDGERPPPVLP